MKRPQCVLHMELQSVSVVFAQPHECQGYDNPELSPTFTDELRCSVVRRRYMDGVFAHLNHKIRNFDHKVDVLPFFIRPVLTGSPASPAHTYRNEHNRSLWCVMRVSQIFKERYETTSVSVYLLLCMYLQNPPSR